VLLATSGTTVYDEGGRTVGENKSRPAVALRPNGLVF
jgi:hypothetical protein